MNPAAPRDPVVTRVLLSIAGALFLLNLSVLLAGVHARAISSAEWVEPSTVHRCIDTHVVVTGPVDGIHDLRINISNLQNRVRRLHWQMDEAAAPAASAESQHPAPSESL